MSLVVVAKFRKSEWRGAVIADNSFQDILVEKNLNQLVFSALADTLGAEYADGQEIVVEVVVKPSPVVPGA